MTTFLFVASISLNVVLLALVIILLNSTKKYRSSYEKDVRTFVKTMEHDIRKFKREKNIE
jgi:cell division protein FtsX